MSEYKTLEYISGILLLEKNKTYGCFKRKKLYKCIPNNKELPEFYIPYKLLLKYNKRLYNKYIIFRYKSEDKVKIYGEIIENIGNVNDINNFYRYELYCNNMVNYLSKKKLDKLYHIVNNTELDIESIIKKYNLNDKRSVRNIYTVDPRNSKDLDDAFSINISDNIMNLSIYISNVSIILDYYNLWEKLTDRISTIYFPGYKLVMLPTILSDNICSLLENRERVVFSINIKIDIITQKIINYNFSNDIIIVSKNYSYKQIDNESPPNYNILYELVKKMNKETQYLEHINDSHGLIAYLMIMMNYYSSKKCVELRNGIYRCVDMDKTYVPPCYLDDDIKFFLKSWNIISSSITNFENRYSHDMLNIDSYIQITSPIRRLTDLLNMVCIQNGMNINFNAYIKIFYDRWLDKIEYINTKMKTIKKIQNNSFLIHKFTFHRDCKTKLHVGFIFEKEVKDHNIFEYTVYLKEYKIVKSFIIDKEIELMKYYNFKIYIFQDEDNFKNKIKLQIFLL